MLLPGLPVVLCDPYDRQGHALGMRLRDSPRWHLLAADHRPHSALAAMKRNPSTHLVLLTGRTEPQFIRTALTTGIHACVHRDDHPVHLLRAFEAVEDWHCSPQIKQILDGPGDPGPLGGEPLAACLT